MILEMETSEPNGYLLGDVYEKFRNLQTQFQY